MKIGDLVKYDLGGSPCGIVVDMIDRKVWRTEGGGNKVNWDLVKPERHAVVLWHHNDGTLAVPVVDLVKVKDDG